jgi:hypothetical protein
MAVAASYLQANGTQQGAWFDLVTMKPLLNSSAFVEAAKTLKELHALVPGAQHTTCESTELSPFLEGNCAMTIETSSFFKVHINLLNCCWLADCSAIMMALTPLTVCMAID